MQESLKRELNKTYLVFSAEKEEYEESYELEMIMKNTPGTILPLHVMRMDEKVEISYDISSKQTLREFMLRGNLSGSMVRELFSKIVMLGEDMKNYLLDIESILLDPEHIYWKGESFSFCYCPWEKKESAQMLQKLLEELLGKLDYSDAKGIELAYHLYQASCSGDFDIGSILREHEEEDSAKSPAAEEVFVHHDRGNSAEVESLWAVSEEKTAEEPKQKEKKQGIFGWLLQFFMKKEEPAEEDKPVEYPDAWEEINKLRIPGEEEDFCFGESPAVYETTSAESAEGKSENCTVLLNSESATTLLGSMPGGKWKLRPLVPGYEEFCISGESFLVGKKRGIVDGYIGRETISRIHSRLYVKADRLYIADANSTNGTYVNGEALSPGTDMEIFAGDRVLFADVAYECYNSL